MCVSHDGKACHSARSTRTPLFRPQNNSQKVLHFVSLEDPGSHSAQEQVPITMQEEVTRGALPSHRLLRNSTRPQVHQPTRKEASSPVTGHSGLLLHLPLYHHWSWEARRQLLLSTKRYPQPLQFLYVPVTGLDCPVWAVRAGQNFSYILEGPGTTNWSLPRDRNLDTHIHTRTRTRGWKVLCKGRHYLHSVTQN